MAVQPAAADNSIDVSDDDSVSQDGDAVTAQAAENTASVENSGNSNSNSVSASSSQTATTSQSNTNTDNDVQSVGATQTDNDFN